MFLAPRSTPLRLLALAGLAGAAALLSNALAPPSRRLAWSGPRAPLPSALPPIDKSAPSEPTSPPLPPPERKQVPLNPPAPVSVAAEPKQPQSPGERKSPAPVSSEATKAPETVVRSPIREISGSEAWAAFQSGSSFLDARRSSEFAESRIASAWCAPVWESDLEDRLFQFKAARRPGPDDPIVIYCSGGDCRDSHLLAAKLLKEGYYHLLIYRDGFPDWVAKGHPIEKGRP